MSLITYEKIVLVSPNGNGVRVDTFVGHQDLIFKLMNSGRIGGGSYGDVRHRLALMKIEKNLARIRESIRKHNSE